MGKLNYRLEEIRKLIPKDIKTILDVGSNGMSARSMFFWLDVKTIDLENADFIQDLNSDQKIRMKDNSVDMVVLSCILEHLATVEEIIKESKRVASKYILVALGNELKIDYRLMYLFGIPKKIEGIEPMAKADGYSPYGHKHFFTIKRIELFIKRFFGGYEKKIYVFGMRGGISSKFYEKNIGEISSNFICFRGFLSN